MLNNNLKFLILICVVLSNNSCQKKFLCPDCETNKPPVANAGMDQLIALPKDSAFLDGVASNDPDGTLTSYKWAKIKGPISSVIITPDSSKTMVKALSAGVYQFELTVKDNGGLSAKDTVQIIVDNPAVNQPPIACAGADQVITLPTNSINLNGSCSTDPDNNITGYVWTKIAGPSSFSITSNVAQTAVNNLTEGIYQFELKVTDAGGLYAKDTVQVTVNNLISVSCDNSNRPEVTAQLIPVGTLSKGRIQIAVASAGTKILFAGGRWTDDCPDCWGSSRVDIYDTVTKVWSTAELSKGRFGIAAVTAGSKIFFAGGQSGDGAFDGMYSTVDIYDASSNTWSVTALSEARGYIAAATVGDKVFFAGGGDGDDLRNPVTNRVDIYNLTSNTWSTTSLKERKLGISAVSVNQKIYFAGGTSALGASDKIDIFDNASGTWQTATLQKPMGYLAGVTYANKIYWASECNVEIKDVTTGNNSTANLFQPGWWAIDDGQNVVEKDNKLIFFRHQSPTNKFDIYDMATNKWSIGVLPQNSTEYSSIISINNTIYIAGGWPINGGTIRTNQVWKLEF
ncbi:MAG TPA: kelch repeat-containing protein [Chitinophagaceae bacterium]|nr:kelch repeat-containing protein [Chitinophagaceae bacterium]